MDEITKPRPDEIYHIAQPDDWGRAIDGGTYAGGATCRADGFIHFSTRDQVGGSLERFFAGRDGLVLLTAHAAALGNGLRWEPASSGALFPHYYGTLKTDRLRLLGLIELGPDGRHNPPLPAIG